MGSLRNRIFVIQKPVPISLDMFSEKDKNLIRAYVPGVL